MKLALKDLPKINPPKHKPYKNKKLLKNKKSRNYYKVQIQKQYLQAVNTN
jgi:hypothetical protein